MSSRSGLRSGVAEQNSKRLEPSPVYSPVTFRTSTAGGNVQIIPVGSKLPGLKAPELKLLRQKQAKLVSNAPTTLETVAGRPQIRNALQATLIFAQYEAGTAVCIDGEGWILTCAHCFGDTEEDYRDSDKRRWLLYYTGLAIQVECRVWDAKRDLALLKVVSIESNDGKAGDIPSFQYVPLCSTRPTSRMSIICIGQPGRDDLESASGRKTKYNLVEVSEGTYQGLVKRADPQDNSEIGSMKHDAWTYWGHSGAPLLRELDGTLIGLHSSWDDETAMRHGVPQVAIDQFLRMKVPWHIRTLLSCIPYDV